MNIQMKNENKFKKNEPQESQPRESNLKLNSNLNYHDSLSALLDINSQEEEEEGEELITIHNAINSLVKEEKHLEAARVIRKIRQQKQKQQSLATSISSSTSKSKQQQQQLFDNEYYATILQKAELIEYVHPVLYVGSICCHRYHVIINSPFFFFFFLLLLVLIHIATCLVSNNKTP